MTSKYIKKYVKKTPRKLFGTPKKSSVRGYVLVEDTHGRKRRKRPYTKGPKRRDINVKGRRYFSELGKELLQKGKHPQKWRARHKWLGPIGAFGDDVIIEIYPSPDGQNLIDETKFSLQPLQNNSDKFSSANILMLIKHNIYERLYGFTAELIETLVPEASHQLRQAMLDSLTKEGGSSPEPKKIEKGFLVVLNTGDLEYSKPVNRMRTDWLAHPGNHSGRSLFQDYDTKKKKLDDPDAITDWYNTVLKKSRIQVKNYYNDFLKEISKMSEVISTAQFMGTTPKRFAKTLFTVRLK